MKKNILQLLVQKVKVESQPRKKCFSKSRETAHDSIILKKIFKKKHSGLFYSKCEKARVPLAKMTAYETVLEKGPLVTSKIKRFGGSWWENVFTLWIKWGTGAGRGALKITVYPDVEQFIGMSRTRKQMTGLWSVGQLVSLSGFDSPSCTAMSFPRDTQVFQESWVGS